MLQKYHKISSAILAVGFLVVIQFFATPTPIFRYLFPACTVFLLALSAYNFFYLKSIDKYNPWINFRIVILFGSLMGLFFLIPNQALRSLFLIASLPVLYFFESVIGTEGEHVLFNEIVVTGFASFVALTGFVHYFPFSILGYLIVIFLVTLILCRASYEITPQTLRTKWLGSIIIALALSELAWAASFLPLHYSVVGFMMFNLFYLLWALYYYYLFNHLTLRKVQFHIGLAILFISLALISTPWSIIS